MDSDVLDLAGIRGRGGILTGRDSADDELLAADGGRVQPLGGRLAWIDRMTHLLDEPESERRQGSDASPPDGRNTWVASLSTLFDEVEAARQADFERQHQWRAKRALARKLNAARQQQEGDHK